MLPYYYVKTGRITVFIFDCYLQNSLLETSTAEHKRSFTTRCQYWRHWARPCRVLLLFLRSEQCKRDEAHYLLHKHPISSSRDGFIQGLGWDLMEILTKHIRQITRQLQLERPCFLDYLQYSSLTIIIPHLPRAVPLPLHTQLQVCQ